MISLKRAILDQGRAEIEQLFTAAQECYLGAIQTIQKHAVELNSQELKDFQQRLGTLRRDLHPSRSAETLKASLATLDGAVCAYNTNVSEALKSGKGEVKQIVELLREATDSLVGRNADHQNSLRRFSLQLEQTQKCESLPQIRSHLQLHVTEFRQSIAIMEREQSEALGPLRQELNAMEARLIEAERLASTDPLTNLYNRRAAEMRGEERLRQGRSFCLVVIDLDRFKSVNDRYGHQCGDQVLQIVARKLLDQVRPTDVVCRWGGDEFLILLECELHFAMQRSSQIGRILKGRFPVTVNGKKIDVEVSASMGVAQTQPGESVAQAFERADAMLYQMKSQ